MRKAASRWKDDYARRLVNDGFQLGILGSGKTPCARDRDIGTKLEVDRGRATKSNRHRQALLEGLGFERGIEESTVQQSNQRMR